MKKKNRGHQVIAIILLVTGSTFLEGCEKNIFEDHPGEGGIINGVPTFLDRIKPFRTCRQ